MSTDATLLNNDLRPRLQSLQARLARDGIVTRRGPKDAPARSTIASPARSTSRAGAGFVATSAPPPSDAPRP